MADEPTTKEVPITSEKKKDPKRVEAGKRLAILSKAARERKKKLTEPKESSNNNIITYVGVAIALTSLALAFNQHQRETKKPEPKYIPETVEVTRKPDAPKLDSLE
ncbi:Hypothetical predicted protein [Paramuricea clavata]|uniref:Uncharacterized protein n=1 Tax=Paramuricea clavata TaxID=317549 RepID=A0A6S7HQ73_PARCT|nr:Hypothetical predicted protein [Paramuricea clavata]